MSAMDREKLGELLSAYLDNELSSRETAGVRRILDEDEDARRLLDELRKTVELVSALPRHRAPSSIAADVQSHVERSELLADVTQTAPVGPAGRGPMRALLSMAAVLVFVVGGAWFLSGDGRWGVAPSGEQVALTPFEDVDTGLDAVSDVKREQTVGPGSEAAGRRSALRGRRSKRKTSAKPRDVRESGNRERDSEAKTLLATADIESKLAVGMGVSSVHRHAFENESVRLRVNVRNAAERDVAMRRLTAYLQSQSAVNLGAHTKDTAEQDMPVGGFYYRGDPAVNFADPRQRQVLVRTSPRDLGGMVGELSSTIGREDAFVLTSGPLTVRGARRVKIAVSGLAESPGSPEDDSPGSRAKADESAGRGSDDTSGLLDELAQTFNLDPSVFTAAKDAISEDRSGTFGRGVSGRTERENDSGPATPTGADGAVADGTYADADTETESDDLSTSRGAAPAGPASTLVERPTLVERRRERLESMRRRLAAEDIRSDSGNSFAGESKSPRRPLAPSPESIESEVPHVHDEVYVTLVVEFVIAGPVTNKTKAKTRTTQPTKPRSKPPEPDTLQK